MEVQDNSENLCPICHESINVSCFENNTNKTTCSHYFHSNCINKWLEKSSTCPVCREQLKEDEIEDTTSEISSIDENEESNDNFIDDYIISLTTTLSNLRTETNLRNFRTLSSLIENNEPIPFGEWFITDIYNQDDISMIESENRVW
jgi:hypothetical protein